MENHCGTMTHIPVLKETHELVQSDSDSTLLGPLELLLYELMRNPTCKCTNSCLLSLINNSLGQASLIILMHDFQLLTMVERPAFFKSYAQDIDCVQPYVFVPDDRTELCSIPLCYTSTAAIFLLSRTCQKLCFTSPSGRKELKRQRLNSALMSSNAQYLRTAPHCTSLFLYPTQINWSHEAFVQFGCNDVEHLQKHMMKHGIHPWKGCLIYAVKNQPTEEPWPPGVAPPTKYDQLLSDLDGCHVTLTDVQHSLLQKLAILAPAQASSSKWNKVAVISLQHSQQNSKNLPPLKKKLVHYMSLESNTLWGTYQHHLRLNPQSGEWEERKLIIDEITVSCLSAISSVSSCFLESLDYIHTSILYSAAHGLQNPHYDFKPDVLCKNGQNMYLGFTPLTEDGMFLQVWSKAGHGTVLYIPLGELVILPSKTMHAGGFCSRASTGNLRLHFYFYLNKVVPESHHTNVYFDEISDFSERYHNAVGLVKCNKAVSGIEEGEGEKALGGTKERGSLFNLFAK